MAYSNITLAAAALMIAPVIGLAQPYKCRAASGQTTFTDLPCPSNQVSSPLVAQPASGHATHAPKPTLSSEALAHEKARVQSAERRQQTQAVIDSSNQRIRQIREENQDPARCQAARARMQQLEKRDGPSVKHTLDYFEYQQKASLYCGNR